MKFLHFILAIFYSLLLISGLCVTFYYSTKYFLSFDNWTAVFIFIAVVGLVSMIRLSWMAGMMLSLPFVLFRNRCKYSVFIPIVLLLLCGVGIIIFPWTMEIEYTGYRIAASIIVDFIAFSLFYGLFYGFFNQD